VGLPNCMQRVAILHSYLTRHNAELGGQAVAPELLAPPAGAAATASTPSVALQAIGARTEGFSGSDLMELCSQVGLCCCCLPSMYPWPAPSARLTCSK